MFENDSRCDYNVVAMWFCRRFNVLPELKTVVGGTEGAKGYSKTFR